jgi:hypothetical protein
VPIARIYGQILFPWIGRKLRNWGWIVDQNQRAVVVGVTAPVNRALDSSSGAAGNSSAPGITTQISDFNRRVANTPHSGPTSVAGLASSNPSAPNHQYGKG